MRSLFGIALLLVCVGGVRAEAIIPAHCRVPNEAPGFCFWSCLDTLARAQKVTSLIGIKEARKHDPDLHIGFDVIPKNGGSYESAKDKFRKMGFTKYKLEQNASPRFIENAVRQGKGCLVHVLLDGGGCHAIIVTDINDRHVKYIDPNLPRRQYLWDTRANFNRAFEGLALMLE